jgi:hypothetical protein
LIASGDKKLPLPVFPADGIIPFILSVDINCPVASKTFLPDAIAVLCLFSAALSNCGN